MSSSISSTVKLRFLPALYTCFWQLYQCNILRHFRTADGVSHIELWGMCDCQGERCQMRIFSSLSLALILFKLLETKSLFVRTEHLFYFIVNRSLTVTWESAERKFLRCFPDQRCRSVCIWLDVKGRKARMTRGFHSGLCVIWKQLVCKTQLAHLRPTHVHQMYEIFPNKGSILSSNGEILWIIPVETWLSGCQMVFLFVRCVTANRLRQTDVAVIDTHWLRETCHTHTAWV